jgi:hypothetical protein
VKDGRWLQRDPTGYADGPNLYETFASNAAADVDPTGTEIWADVLRYKKKVNGIAVWVVQYRLNRNGIDLGIRGLLNSEAVETRVVGTEYWPVTNNLRKQARCAFLIEQTRQLVEETQEVQEDVATLADLTRVSLTAAVALPAAAIVGPVAEGLFSTTTIGITETTLAGNIAATSLTGGVSLGTGSAVAEGLVGGSPSDVLSAGLSGVASGAILGAPVGFFTPVGRTVALPAAPSIVLGRGAQLRAKLGTQFDEYLRFRGQGFTPAQAKYLTQPYEGMGHHFIPRRWGLPGVITKNALNVMKPEGISIGRFYERHYYADLNWKGTAFPEAIGGSWSGSAIGLQRPGVVGRLWYASPTPLKVTAGAGAAAGAGGAWWWTTESGE